MGIVEAIRRGVLKVWDDLYDASLDDKAAPNLCDVYLGREASIYADPEAFFEHTYMTRHMSELIEEVADALKGGRGGRIFLLTSLFGGGKTHTLITLYHAFNSPEKLAAIDERLAAKVSEIGKVQVIVMDASSSKLVPHPDEPCKIEGFTIKTIWGMLAYMLGAYARIRELDDENAPAPSLEIIRDVLSEARMPTLILVDEIVHYIFNMYKSRLRDYGEKVLLFLDYLARAVESLPNIVLVVSIQAEYRITEGQRTLIEEDMFRGYAGSVLKVLSRESSRLITPVTPDDVVKVLQKRIFKEISEKEAWAAQEKLYKAYREAPDIFGVESDWQFASSETGRVATARETYPFHPKYIEVLHEFISRNKDLQKTRDAIRITRKVVRRILRGAEDPEFVMPWHIDFRDSGIRNRVLTDSYKEFRDIASKDIVSEDGRLGSIADCSKPQLALRIATSVFLKTYTYETFKEPLKVFPDFKTIALMVYEPSMFSSENWQPSDIATILDEMEGRLLFFVAERGRYWFTPYPSVIDYVRRRADELLRGPRIELYKAAKEYARNLLVRREGRRAAIEGGELFREQNVVIIGYGDEVWGGVSVKDDPSMKLVVFVKPGVSHDDVERIILQRVEGGRRIYANTVVVVYPASDRDFDILLRYVANIKAAEEIMNALSEYYADRDIRSLQERKLKRYIDENMRLLTGQLLSLLTRVAYPKGGRIEEGEATPSTSIIEQVEVFLKDHRSGEKLRTNIEFDDLRTFLKDQLGWDLVDGDRIYEFREIMEIFYTNTYAPFTTRRAVERAVISGVENLDLGVKSGEKLYWKRIGPEDGVEKPEGLEDRDQLLPYRTAAKILVDKLLSESGLKIEPEGARRVWYEVEIDGRRVKLDELIRQDGWENAVKIGVILRMEELIPRGFILEVKPSNIEIEPGKPVEAYVKVEPAGGYSEKITIKVDEGTLDIKEGYPPFTAKWSLPTLHEPGKYTFTVRATGSDGISKDETLNVVVLSPEIDIDVSKLDLTHVGSKLVSITVSDLPSLRLCLSIVSRLGVEVKADVDISFGGWATFKGEDMDTAIARIFVDKFDDIMRQLPRLDRETSVKASIMFDEPLTIDSSRIAPLQPLSGRVKFKLKVRRGSTFAGSN